MTDPRFAHEQRLTILARHGQSVRRRWAFGLLGFALGIADAWLHLFPTSSVAIALPSIGLLAANWWCVRRIRAGRADVAHFWAMLVGDALVIALTAAMTGHYGTIALGFYLVIAAAYGLGLPRAARVHVALSVVLYPTARILGHATSSDVVLETTYLLALSWLAVASPMRFTGRLRRARRALGALERGDFHARLPERALDDLGFLAVSFNRTAESLGTSVATLRASEARTLAIAGAAGELLAADSEGALCAVIARACIAMLPVVHVVLGVRDSDTHDVRYLDPLGTPIDGPLDRDDAGDAVVRTPIVAGGVSLGVLVVTREHGTTWSVDDRQAVAAIAALAATALRNIQLVDALRRSHEALAHRAFHDPLTGLANRARFDERLGRALASDHADRTVVLMIDLDGFKSVNDGFGHAVGDRLLSLVGERLLDATRGRDTVARLGGDEFAVLLEQVDHVRDAEIVAARIVRALSQPYAFDGALATVGASVGVARHGDGAVRGDDDEPLDIERASADLVRRADAAMYAAKLEGKGRVAVYDDALSLKSSRETPVPIL